MPQRVRLDRAGRFPKFLPVGSLSDHGGALALDHVRRVSDIGAQLCVMQKRESRLLKGGRLGGIGDADGHVVPSSGSLPVEARISAMWAVRMPVFWRCSPPKMCIRQELSTAVTYSAWVLSMSCIFSASIAADTSPIFTAKVPPKPQQRSTLGRSSNSMPRTLRRRRSGKSPR